MNEAAAPERRAALKEKGEADGTFEETFRPKKGIVNFGKMKHEKAAGKRRGALRKILIALLTVAVLLGGAFAALHFTGLLTPLLEMAGISVPAETQLTPEEREALLASREATLDKREKDLQAREEKLAAKEAEAAAQSEEAEPVESFAEWMEGLSDETLASLKKVGTIYSKMDPAGAAAILGSLGDLREISSILYCMQPAASALVLEQMEEKTAADITAMMLG